MSEDAAFLFMADRCWEVRSTGKGTGRVLSCAFCPSSEVPEVLGSCLLRLLAIKVSLGFLDQVLELGLTSPPFLKESFPRMIGVGWSAARIDLGRNRCPLGLRQMSIPPG